MVLAHLAQLQPHATLPRQLPIEIVLLVAGSVCAFILSYLFIRAIIYLYRKSGWVRPVEPGRKPDHVARLGGVGIFLAFAVASLIFYMFNANSIQLTQKEATIYWLFLAASTLTVIVNAYDDLKPMKPLPKLIAQTLTVAIILGPFFNGLFNGVLLFGFSNPFQAPSDNSAPITLFIHSPQITWLALPAVFFTWFWMVGMMNTVNWIDGVDGLAGGVVAITSICITIISWTLHQYTISILAGIFTGAVLGFLLLNWSPAKVFMGDSGSQFLGLGLAVLSIMGGAKLALALMVMGIPILNMAMVIINRVRRGQSPLHYDASHLHDRLRATGLSARQICYVLYSFTAIFGFLALWFVHIYKLLGIALVVLTMVALIAWIDYRQRKQSEKSKPLKPNPTVQQTQGKEQLLSEKIPTTDAQQGGALPTTPSPISPTSQPQRGSSGEHFRAQLHP